MSKFALENYNIPNIPKSAHVKVTNKRPVALSLSHLWNVQTRGSRVHPARHTRVLTVHRVPTKQRVAQGLRPHHIQDPVERGLSEKQCLAKIGYEMYHLVQPFPWDVCGRLVR